MDKLLYVAMSGASETMKAQAVAANNIANVTTPGFRAELEQQRSMPVYGNGFPTRVYAGTESPGYKFDFAAVNHTENPLHVAVHGKGWFAVQGPDGTEGYTRRGDMQIDENGQLVNGYGYLMLGQGGPITLPPAESVTIAQDGTLSIVPFNSEPGTTVVVDQLRVVNPDESQLYKRADGLFALRTGGLAEPDASIMVTQGTLESSNVNAVGELIDLISLARKHELDVKMMKTAQENDQVSARILQIS